MQSSEPKLERVPSGIHGLDSVLGGGFFKAGVYIVQGAPGAGKTVLANQICYNRVAAGGRALYVTLLAETHARMMLNISAMRFFDSSAVPECLYYISAFRVLEEEGLKGLLDLLRRETRRHRCDLMVLDGLIAAEEQAGSEREFKKFIHEVQTQAGLAGCSVFLLTSGSGRRFRPEQTMVDGLFLLTDELKSYRAERRLEVAKFRGSGHLRGHHTFEITDDGIAVYPRLEVLLARPASTDPLPPSAKLSTGVVGLDERLGGGVPGASMTLVLGPSGSGKTTLALQFIAQASAEEPGLFFGFFEPPRRLLHKAQQLGLELDSLVGKGALEVIWHPALEHCLDALGGELLEAVKRRNVKRLVIDGWHGFEQAPLAPERLLRFFTALVCELRGLGVTSYCTVQRADGRELDLEPLSTAVENTLMLRFSEQDARLRHELAIVKMRDVRYDSTISQMFIGKKGVELGDSVASDRGPNETRSVKAPPGKNRRRSK